MSIHPNLDTPLRGAAVAIALALGPLSAPAGAADAPGTTPRVPVASTPAPPVSGFVVTTPAISLTGIPNVSVTAPTISVILSPTSRPTSGR